MGVLKRRADDEAGARLAASVVGYGLGLAPDDIIDQQRGSAQIAFARQVAMYLCHVGFELSLSRVAAAFARDPSTVAHACHAIEDRRDEGHFDLWIGSLEAMLRAAPSPGVAQEARR